MDDRKANRLSKVVIGPHHNPIYLPKMFTFNSVDHPPTRSTSSTQCKLTKSMSTKLLYSMCVYIYIYDYTIDECAWFSFSKSRHNFALQTHSAEFPGLRWPVLHAQFIQGFHAHLRTEEGKRQLMRKGSSTHKSFVKSCDDMLMSLTTSWVKCWHNFSSFWSWSSVLFLCEQEKGVFLWNGNPISWELQHLHLSLTKMSII